MSQESLINIKNTYFNLGNQGTERHYFPDNQVIKK